MKKVLTIILSLILVMGMTLTAVAVEVTGCAVTAESVTAAAGEQVSVPVKITSNQGFTNFAIALDYDRDDLELVSIEPSELCGDLVSVNTEWDFSADENAAQNEAFAEGNTYGYITCASSDAVTGDGELFTATFNVSEDFSGTAEVTPVVSYMRNNSAVYAVFEEVSVQASAGTVTLEGDVLAGDVDGNGMVTSLDAALAFAASIDSSSLTETQKAAADVDGNGMITSLDAALIFSMSLGG